MNYIVTDIETVPHDCAKDFVPAPDLSAITAAKNLKDPVKIAADIEARKADAVSDYEGSLSRAALDWNINRIVALAWRTDPETSRCLVCRDEQDETEALTEFWRAYNGRRIVGFCARTFDAPTLIQRSRLLGLRSPRVKIDRFGRGDVVDVRDVLTFDDARYEAIMPRSLKSFCRRFGIPVSDEIDGADIPALVAAGEWDKVQAHVTSDVDLTYELALRVGAIWNRQDLSGLVADEAAGF